MILNITDFCKAENATQGVINAIEKMQSGDTLFFEKNEYHFYKDFSQHRLYHMTNTDSFVKPEKYFAVLIEKKENITIDGGGSVFVIHGDMCAFAAVKSSNLVLKNFTVRYNSPTNFELTVLKKTARKIVYSIPKNSSYSVKFNQVKFFEKSPFSGKNYYLVKNNNECYCNVIHRGNEVFRTILSPLKTAYSVKKTGDNQIECKYLIPPKFEVGDTVAMSRNRCRDSCGLFFWECKNVSSENITVNYMHGFGWLSQMCENLSFEKINFEPYGEYKVSSFADCIHICGCKGEVKINNCFFTHPHDDGINIHGAFLRLENQISSKKALFRFVHKQQGGYSAFYKGDKVKLYYVNNLQELDGIFTVKSASDNINDKTVVLEFEEELPVLKKKSVVIENITYNPKVTISNCLFKAIPTRGILCTTDRPSEIYSNVFESLKMPDIYISCDCSNWYESGPCKNMKIYKNKFSQTNPVVLEPICKFKPVDNVHENIEIFDNEQIG